MMNDLNEYFDDDRSDAFERPINFPSAKALNDELIFKWWISLEIEVLPGRHRGVDL
jgi:hypothetical protein